VEQVFTGAALMELFDIISKAWPIILAFITLVIVLSKLDLRVAVLEEKVKTMFDLLNRKADKP
jgi:hypothetical protein